jgi:hypothetical protein
MPDLPGGEALKARSALNWGRSGIWYANHLSKRALVAWGSQGHCLDGIEANLVSKIFSELNQ